MLVAPARQREHRRLVGVLQHRIAARHVAVERGIADAHLALVAGGEQHLPARVGQRHQRDHPQPRLDVLGGKAAHVGQHLAERVHARSDRHDVMAAAEQPGAFARVLEALLAGIFGREHHARDLLRAERIDRDGGRQRAVDAAGKAEDHAGEAVALHIIVKAHHHRPVDVLGEGIERVGLARHAAPASRSALPIGDQQRFVPVAQLHDALAVGVDDEGRAVEHQLVLAADAVEIGDRKRRLQRAAANQPIALVVLVELVGAAVGHQQHLGARPRRDARRRSPARCPRRSARRSSRP